MNLLEFTTQTWITVGIVAAIFAGSALVIGALILVVSKVFKVDVDEKITKILENLAGANCGAVPAVPDLPQNLQAAPEIFQTATLLHPRKRPK